MELSEFWVQVHWYMYVEMEETILSLLLMIILAIDLLSCDLLLCTIMSK